MPKATTKIGSIADALRKSAQTKRATSKKAFVSDNVNDLFTVDEAVARKLAKEEEEQESSDFEIVRAEDDEPESEENDDTAEVKKILSKDQIQDKNERTVFIGNLPKDFKSKVNNEEFVLY